MTVLEQLKERVRGMPEAGEFIVAVEARWMFVVSLDLTSELIDTLTEEEFYAIVGEGVTESCLSSNACDCITITNLIDVEEF